MTDKSRLIESAFPLKQASLDSVREKYGPLGHISGFHLWPARRPLAASRAALIATLLPDPGTQEGRLELCEKIGGKVVKRVEKKKMPGGQSMERDKEDTDGGILQWKRETENSKTVDWFRERIRKVYGRAPKVLDPFSGGGAIPFEAMRLGCEATAIDINPVAWFVLKCTLEYPQKLAGQRRPLPTFILQNQEFMESYFKAQGFKGKMLKQQLEAVGFADNAGRTLKGLGFEPPEIEADLAWHVRAWGQWVFERARTELAQYYPLYADFEPLWKDQKSYEQQPMRLVPLKDNGAPDIDALNREFSTEYLANKKNPRWVAKPTAAFLWARAVPCKYCPATIPLLKTRWLCKKDNKRVLLTMESNADKSRVVFGIERNVPIKGGNTAQRREHDKRISAGTMTRAGAKCPCCGTMMTMEDLRLEGKASRMSSLPTAVVTDSQQGKQYRLPSDYELECASRALSDVDSVFDDVPFGIPNEPTPSPDALGMRIPKYGFSRWADLFSPRQLVALGTLVKTICSVPNDPTDEWQVATRAYLSCALDRLVDQSTTLCTWYLPGENVKHTYVRYALPIVWDYAEANPLFEGGGSWSSAIRVAAAALDHALLTASAAPAPHVLRQSATSFGAEGFDLVVTDPPYYDAIPYSDLMDLFYIWLRRSIVGVAPDYEPLRHMELCPKWSTTSGDGELIDDQSRHDGDKAKSKNVYEDGMARAFSRCAEALRADGRFVVVFAHKDPEAWETLVGALIRASFVVDASWPIQTENATRSRARGSAALASSLWLICKKRPGTARPGWDNKVLDEMRSNISTRLREFWDAGIRGPDFVWAATGPALEAYSKHPVVKKADDPGQILTVSEFLNHARRMVVDFVVGRVLTEEGGVETAATDRLDEPTAYYLLHRNDFHFEEAPIGACILYATACGLSDHELVRDWDLLIKSGDDSTFEADADEESSVEEERSAEESSSGSKVKLKAWSQRRGRLLGYEAPGGRPIPLIDRIHRLMHLWKGGDVHKVDEYLDEHGLRRHELFRRVLQTLIEISRDEGRKDELNSLENLSNHIGAKGAKKKNLQRVLTSNEDE